jgi:para-aminobenzoate synthetase/4-amino-4-deoxychorismate lyase
MIVDLLRNDLGRIARDGSVIWTDLFRAERFETVWQLTSTVSARLRPDAGLVVVFRALFPCGSVTGAPKVSTMGIIAALEDSPRGVYCGTVGYLAPPGNDGPRARFNVAIRTVVQDAASGLAEYGVGGGITWDSRAAAEYDEAVAKARVLTARRPPFSLFETMRAVPGEQILHLDRHLDRLLASAAYFGFRADRGAIQSAIGEHTQTPIDRPVRVRLVLDRLGRIEVTVTVAPSFPDEVHVGLDTAEPVDPADVFLFHKTTLRGRYERARERRPDVDDAILTNTRGELTESTIANVAALVDGTWCTPPLDAGLLAGIGRQIAIEEGRLVERPVSIEEALVATELALVSDNRGWRRAVLVDDQGR